MPGKPRVFQEFAVVAAGNRTVRWCLDGVGLLLLRFYLLISEKEKKQKTHRGFRIP